MRILRVALGAAVLLATTNVDLSARTLINAPDGRKIVYSALSTPTNVSLRYPAWSPRSDQIVFELAAGTGNLWLLEDLH